MIAPRAHREPPGFTRSFDQRAYVIMHADRMRRVRRFWARRFVAERHERALETRRAASASRAEPSFRLQQDALLAMTHAQRGEYRWLRYDVRTGRKIRTREEALRAMGFLQ